MPLQATERRSVLADALDIRCPAEILSVLHKGQVDAAQCVASASAAIAEAAQIAAQTISSGGKLVYVAAGSSGLMALSDGLELPGTFSISPEKVVVLMAGGQESLVNMTGSAEDGENQAVTDVRAAA